MNSNRVYSSSLKKMLGFKIFTNINPEDLNIKKIKPKQLSFLKQEKTQKQLGDIKKKIAESSKKRHVFNREIQKIIEKVAQESHIQIKQSKLKRKNHHKSYRIINEPAFPSELNDKKITLPTIQSTTSFNNIKKRMKTEAYNLDQLTEKTKDSHTVNVGKLIKHYRAGMSSLKKINISLEK